jgi:hypothetical protein
VHSPQAIPGSVITAYLRKSQASAWLASARPSFDAIAASSRWPQEVPEFVCRATLDLLART